MNAERILVIKLGALGDMIIALGPMQAIRRHHPAAEIAVLTRPPFVRLVEMSGTADRVLSDPAPSPWQFGTVLRLRHMLRAVRFDRVYDLQGSDRSRAYAALLGTRGRREADWCSRPPRRRLGEHAFDRHVRQLHAAGIGEVPPADLSWLRGDLEEFDFPDRYVLLVPGSAPHRPEKRWPATAYAELAKAFARAGVVPVVVGASQESELARTIVRSCGDAVDLTGRTSLGQLASLGRGACGAVGNDTGPIHILAGAGCPSLVLFSAASDPSASRPLGCSVGFLRAERLEDLPPQAVISAAFDRGLVSVSDGAPS